MAYDFERIFAQDGQRASIADDDYKGGWFDVVGGLNGVPTVQQFNAIMHEQEAKTNETHALAVKNEAKITEMFSYNADTKTLHISTASTTRAR